MIITKDSYIKLVRFDVTKEHQLTFSDGAAQVDFFNNLEGQILEASSYQRKDFKIRFPALIDSIEKYNYAIVQNKPESYKYYFYYITDMEYISDELTDVTIKLDVFQTYQFDFNYKRCFIEREHTNNDAVGLNVIPEGLEKGEYIVDSIDSFDDFDDYCYMVQVTKTEYGTELKGVNIGGIYFVGGFYVCMSYADVFALVEDYTEDEDLGFDSILNVFLVPYNTTQVSLVYQPKPAYGKYLLQDTGGVNMFSKKIYKPTTIDGYTPINKKLLTSEFCYLVASNNNGVNETFSYETFSGTECRFSIYGLPTFGGSIVMTPINYGNENFMVDNYSIAGGKFPATDIQKDNYQIWLRQNALNLQLGVVGGVVDTTFGVIRTAGGDYSGLDSIGSGLGQIKDVMIENYLHSKTPITSTGIVNIGDVQLSLRLNKFIFSKMCIKSQMARKIDNFFSMFGYKTNDVKLPNITGRLNWNYVKTISAIVESETVPEKYLNEYKSMLNNGITFWHNPQTFMDYSQSNSIV